MKNRLIAVFITAALLEISSTMYISSVSARSITMIAWAGIGPWFDFPFTSSMIEATDLKQRFLITLSLAAGYVTGSAIIYLQL
jgi:hypothetical protein